MKGTRKNAYTQYYQLALPNRGYSDKPDNANNDSTKNIEAATAPSSEFWKQKSYILSIPVVITQVSSDSGEYEYAIQVPINLDVPMSPNVGKGKRLSKEVLNLVKEQRTDKTKISLVYGVQQEGSDTLSLVVKYASRDATPYIFSRILGKVDRAIKSILLHATQEENEGTKNEGSSVQSPQTSQDLGEPKKYRRGKKVRAKIRNEALPEKPTELDGPHRKILGGRSGNEQDKLGELGSDTVDGWTIETVPF